MYIQNSYLTPNQQYLTPISASSFPYENLKLHSETSIFLKKDPWDAYFEIPYENLINILKVLSRYIGSETDTDL